MERQVRDALEAKVARHCRSRRWALLGRSRCGECGWQWPCPAYGRAQRRLDDVAAPDWASLATRANPSVAPLLTYGQRYRSCGDLR
jgi:hypothetical protein